LKIFVDQCWETHRSQTWIPRWLVKFDLATLFFLASLHARLLADRSGATGSTPSLLLVQHKMLKHFKRIRIPDPHPNLLKILPIWRKSNIATAYFQFKKLVAFLFANTWEYRPHCWRTLFLPRDLYQSVAWAQKIKNRTFLSLEKLSKLTYYSIIPHQCFGSLTIKFGVVSKKREFSDKKTGSWGEKFKSSDTTIFFYLTSIKYFKASREYCKPL
jgi:hypothetical protein